MFYYWAIIVQCILDMLSNICLQIFSPSLNLPFSLFLIDSMFWSTEVWINSKIILSFTFTSFSGLRNLYLIQVHKDIFCLWLAYKFYSFRFYIKSMINLRLIFVYGQYSLFKTWISLHFKRVKCRTRLSFLATW